MTRTRTLAIIAAALLCAGPAVAGDDALIAEWLRAQRNLLGHTGALEPPPSPKEGELCEVRTGAIFCGRSVVCRAFIGPMPFPDEENWPPRREGDSIVCDDRDRPSHKAKVQLR